MKNSMKSAAYEPAAVFEITDEMADAVSDYLANYYEQDCEDALGMKAIARKVLEVAREAAHP